MSEELLVIVGSGPAAYTAAIYASRAKLNPLVFEGFYSGPPGGQLMTTTDVENFPGFPEGITGPELMINMKKQAARFGTRFLSEDVEYIELSDRPFVIKTKKAEYTAQSVIIATGASAKKLDIPGTRAGELWQKGVSACAICDGAMPLFKEKDLYVIGGGDSAAEEALFLTKYARQVYVVHRRDELRASKIMAQRLIDHPKVTILWDSVLEEVLGENVVSSVKIKNIKSGNIEMQEAGGVFFAIGHTPNTSFVGDQLKKTESGYLEVTPGTSKTSLEGVFIAGDVHDSVYRQAITAAGSGCMAALDAERYLSHLGLLDE